MATKDDLAKWVVEALDANNGSAKIVDVCKYVREKHEDELRSAGNLFYMWQYDIRWAATRLRGEGKMRSETMSPKGVWELK